MTFEEWRKSVPPPMRTIKQAWNAAQRAERERYQELIAAAEAVLDRWETPLWKDVEPTAKVIYRMRDVIERMKEKAE